MKSFSAKFFNIVSRILLLILVLLFCSVQQLSAQSSGKDDKEKLQQFEDAITKGEQFLASKDYAKAKAEYQKALSIDPSAKFPKDKLALIRKFYVDPADEVRYTQAMESGNRFMNVSDFASARNQFEIAVNIKPEEKTAREKLAEADKLNQAKQENTQRFNKLIADADRFYAAKDISSARTAYEAASQIDPSASYPRQRIGEIDAKLSAEKALKESYDKALSDGDEAYMNRDYATARLKYEQALKIKPGENYPKSMLERVSQGSANLKDAEQNYQQAIASADKLFNDKDYETALSAYQNASKILPGEKYPSEQIGKINLLLDKKKKLEEEYATALTKGNQLFELKQYTEAKHEFQKANDLKPGEAYPKQKIEEIAGILLALKEADRRKAYEKEITEADQLYKSKDYSSAIEKYREAAVIKSDETYPGEQIAAINKIISEEQAARSIYEKTISDADRKFTQEAWEEAIALYESALKQNSDKSYPAQQIQKARAEIALSLQKEEAYNEAVSQADQYRKSTNYTEALKAYQQSLTIKPGSAYPMGQIAEIKATIEANKSKDEQYQHFISNADQLFKAGSLKEAINEYNQALIIKPDEKYPADQVIRINKLTDELNAKNSAYNRQIADADKFFNEANYDKALTKYNEALLTLPSEDYPKVRISSINSILEQRKSLEENYNLSIAAGDKALNSGNFKEALSSFENAKALKPDEKYPHEKISLIEKRLSDQKVISDKYQIIIAEADRLFNNGILDAAASKYAEARNLKPDETYPQEQLGVINNLIARQKEVNELYRTAISEADRYLNTDEPDKALARYQDAKELKPSEIYPEQQIEKINARKGEIKQQAEAYNNAINKADSFFENESWEESLIAYKEAVKLNPSAQYPKDRITLIGVKKSEQEALNSNYQSVILEADRLFDRKEYKNALQSYQKALALKPSEKYPETRIGMIGSIIEEQEQMANRDYNLLLENANRLFSLQDYTSARRFYEDASALKPGEAFPRNKLIEINNILMERSRNQMDAYNKIIMKADLAYQDKVFDQAIDAYEEAKTAKPDEAYPDEMIRKIRKYMEDHAMVDLVSAPILIAADSEQKFKFRPIEMRLRKNNYIVLKARKITDSEPKVYLNYGIDGQKSGGIVLRSIKSQETGDYIVRVSIQDKWYRMDNNWISIYAEGSAVEISKMQISQGD